MSERGGLAWGAFTESGEPQDTYTHTHMQTHTAQRELCAWLTTAHA